MQTAQSRKGLTHTHESWEWIEKFSERTDFSSESYRLSRIREAKTNAEM